MNGQIKIDGFDDPVSPQYLEHINRAASLLPELREAIENCSDLREKKQLEIMRVSIEYELQESFKVLLSSIINDSEPTIRSAFTSLKKDIREGREDAVNAFLKALEQIKEGEAAHQDLYNAIQQEILSIIENPKTSQQTAIEYNPFLSSAMTAAARGNTNQLISFSNRDGAKRSMTLKEGSLSVYDTAVLNRVIREYRLGNVTSKKEIVFILDDFCRAMNGKKGTPSTKQRADIKAALETIRNTPFSFITSDELSQILGIEAAARLEGFKGMKLDDPKLHETHLIDRLDMVTRYKRRGKKTTAVVLTLGDTFQSLIDSFPWYEEIDSSVNNVQVLKDGELTDWTYSKERQALKFYIQKVIFAKIRANTAGKAFSNKVNYSSIFADCQIDITHRQQLKRKTEDVKTIFADLQRKGFITRFSEYNTKTEEKAGIQYTTPKFEYTEIGG